MATTTDGIRERPTRGQYLAEALVVIGVLVVPTVALLLLPGVFPDWFATLVAMSTLPGAALASWWFARAGGFGSRDLGLGRPQSWPRTLLAGVGAGLAMLTIAVWVVTPAVEAWFGRWLDPALLDPLTGNVGALLINVLLVSWLHAALCEEIIFRGFLLQRLELAFGAGGLGLGLALVVQALLFGLAHFPQGVAGVVATSAGGLLWGAVFLELRRNLWVVIVGHALMDTTLFVLVFLGQHRWLLSN